MWIVCIIGISYVLCRNLREDVSSLAFGFVGPMDLHDEVLRCNSEAFEYATPGKQSLLS